MDKGKGNGSNDKYIPPHRRQQNPTAISNQDKAKGKSKQPVKFGKKRTSVGQSLPFFTPHASLRQEQRNISDAMIDKTLRHGEKLPSIQSTTLINESTQVVLSKNGSVITVQDNKRNTNHDLLRISKGRVAELSRDIELHNNDYAMCELAEIYLNGELVNRDVQKAYELLMMAVDKGNSHAMCLIAKLHEQGDLGVTDLKASREWLEKAAKRNNKYALAVLGQHYLSEYRRLSTTEENLENKKAMLEKMMFYLKKSSDRGSTRAMWQMAKIYEEGWLGEKDMAKAIKIYSEAARLGSPTSLQELQRLVKEEKFSPEEFETILEKASALIAKTSSELAVEIGLEQIKGKLGTNPRRGFYMLEQAAKRNNEEAIAALAKCYNYGIGCEIDSERSQYWYQQLKTLYEKAGSQGNINALINLGDLYLEGKLGKIDLENAEKLFIRAAKTGDIDSIYILGRYYIEGRLGNHDPAEGIPWVNRAIELWSKQAERGNIDAAKALIDIHLDKQLGFKNYQKAAQWLSLLARKGDKQALSDLLSLYIKKKINLNPIEDSQIFTADVLAIIKKQALEEEQPKALYALSELHRDGITLDEVNAVSMNPWAKRLEDSLHAKGMKEAAAALYLGRLYKKEHGPLPKNLQEATKWLCIANCLATSEVTQYSADNELKAMLNSQQWSADERAQILAGILEGAEQSEKITPYKVGRILGDIYLKGKLCEVDTKIAYHWYEVSAKLNNSKAMYRLGEMHMNGELGTVDVDGAMKWFGLSAARGNEKAIKYLRELCKSEVLSLEQKNILKQNLQNYQKMDLPNQNKLIADEQVKRKDDLLKYSSWMYAMGKQYKEGNEKTDKDYCQAAFWFRRVIDKNHSGAAFELAQLYYSEQLGEKARPVAIRFFKLAAKGKHLEAIKKLIEIYTEGTLTKTDPEKIAKWQMRESDIKKTLHI